VIASARACGASYGQIGLDWGHRGALGELHFVMRFTYIACLSSKPHQHVKSTHHLAYENCYIPSKAVVREHFGSCCSCSIVYAELFVSININVCRQRCCSSSSSHTPVAHKRSRKSRLQVSKNTLGLLHSILHLHDYCYYHIQYSVLCNGFQR